VVLPLTSPEIQMMGMKRGTAVMIFGYSETAGAQAVVLLDSAHRLPHQ